MVLVILIGAYLEGSSWRKTDPSPRFVIASVIAVPLAGVALYSAGLRFG